MQVILSSKGDHFWMLQQENIKGKLQIYAHGPELAIHLPAQSLHVNGESLRARIVPDGVTSDQF
jgi:hypothetical protein